MKRLGPTPATYALAFAAAVVFAWTAAFAANSKAPQKSTSTPPPASQDANAAPSAAAAPAPAVAADPAVAPTTLTGDANATGAVNGAGGDDTPFDVKLRQIEQRVSELKEKVFQSKARLLQLQEVVLHGSLAGSKAVLIHRNEMGSSFRLNHVQYALDGVPILNRLDESGDGSLDKEPEFEVFNGATAPGTHQISVLLEYAGNGFGIFSYLQGYKFVVKSSYTFNADENKITTVRIVGYEKGGLTTELKDRPAVRYDIDTTPLERAKASPSNANDSTPLPNVAPSMAPSPAAEAQPSEPSH